MFGLEDFGKMLLMLGGLIFLLGLVFTFGPKVPLIGRLPGDIVLRRENFSCYFPIVTSIVLSILLTIILNLILRVIR
ncbi:MAG: DUF2905 domain-containing protein [Anaerolineae bacterium]